MKLTKNLLVFAMFVMFVMALNACATSHSAPVTSPTQGGTVKADSSVKADTTIAPQTIKIATFNIQNLGVTKMGKADVVKELVAIVHKYDVIAVQEISDVHNKTAFRFLDSINHNQKVTYGLVLSSRSGQQPDDLSSQEQYAFYYKTSTIKDLGLSTLYNDSASDFFEREPFLAHFKVVKGDLSFVLCTVHTKPEVAVAEIKSLDNVIQWARIKYNDEVNFIALGDFKLRS